jgi:hypothetical protein
MAPCHNGKTNVEWTMQVNTNIVYSENVFGPKRNRMKTDVKL